MKTIPFLKIQLLRIQSFLSPENYYIERVPLSNKHVRKPLFFGTFRISPMVLECKHSGATGTLYKIYNPDGSDVYDIRTCAEMRCISKSFSKTVDGINVLG